MGPGPRFAETIQGWVKALSVQKALLQERLQSFCNPFCTSGKNLNEFLSEWNAPTAKKKISTCDWVKFFLMERGWKRHKKNWEAQGNDGVKNVSNANTYEAKQKHFMNKENKSITQGHVKNT